MQPLDAVVGNTVITSVMSPEVGTPGTPRPREPHLLCLDKVPAVLSTRLCEMAKLITNYNEAKCCIHFATVATVFHIKCYLRKSPYLD